MQLYACYGCVLGCSSCKVKMYAVSEPIQETMDTNHVVRTLQVKCLNPKPESTSLGNEGLRASATNCGFTVAACVL